MESKRTRVGRGLAKALGIKLDYRNETGQTRITRGESVFSIESADSYVEDEPTSAEWIKSITPSGRDMWNYFRSLFPFTTWITKYNSQWFFGDLIAGQPSCNALNPQAALTVEQVLLLAQLSSLKEWHMRSWRNCPFNTASTPHSWGS